MDNKKKIRLQVPSSGLSYSGCTFLCFCKGNVKSRSELTY